VLFEIPLFDLLLVRQLSNILHICQLSLFIFNINFPVQGREGYAKSIFRKSLARASITAFPMRFGFQ